MLEWDDRTSKTKHRKNRLGDNKRQQIQLDWLVVKSKAEEIMSSKQKPEEIPIPTTLHDVKNGVVYQRGKYYGKVNCIRFIYFTRFRCLIVCVHEIWFVEERSNQKCWLQHIAITRDRPQWSNNCTVYTAWNGLKCHSGNGIEIDFCSKQKKIDCFNH